LDIYYFIIHWMFVIFKYYLLWETKHRIYVENKKIE
jgi:hypothetical protein